MNIGKALPATIEGRAAVMVVAVLVLTIELSNAFLPVSDPVLPWASAFIGAAAIGILSNWNLASMGFRFAARPSWSRWLTVSAAMAAIVLALSGLAVLAAIRGHDLFALCNRRFPPLTWSRFIDVAVTAPLVEEVTYRLVLVSAAVAIFGEWPAIAIGGCVFAGSHWIYGVQGPDNFIAGFLLSWAYLNSRTLLVPILVHVGGNLGALALQHYIAALTC